MAQIKFRADLEEMEFPMLSDWAGRNIMRADYDLGEHTPLLPRNMYQPGVVYCQDVLPVTNGYKSVTYTNLLAASSDGNITFSKVFTVLDTNMNRALVGITTDSNIYIITSTNYAWQKVTPAGWIGGDNVTVGSSNGNYYLYLKQFGCYLVNVVGISLTATTLTSIVATDIQGMTSSMNYLILWDATTVYWNSNVNPTDFTPSLITGAGSSVPIDLEGNIVFCEKLATGFVIYSTINIVLAAFSNNSQFPWIFQSAPSGSGILSSKDVSYAENLGYQIAITTAGILQVNLHGAVMVHPEVGDFLSAQIYETYNFTSQQLTQTPLAANLIRQVTVIASRYIVVSYGITTLTDAIVLDSVLNRFGKLHIDHVGCFEVGFNVQLPSIPYNSISISTNTYISMSPRTYNNLAASFNTPPASGQSMGFLQASGQVQIASLNYDSDTDNAILMLGKFQLVRSNLVQLLTIEVESVPATSTSFSIYSIPTLDGKDYLPSVIPGIDVIGANMRRYRMRSIGKNHIIVCKGSFNLNTIEITVVNDATR